MSRRDFYPVFGFKRRGGARGGRGGGCGGKGGGGGRAGIRGFFFFFFFSLGAGPPPPPPPPASLYAVKRSGRVAALIYRPPHRGGCRGILERTGRREFDNGYRLFGDIAAFLQSGRGDGVFLDERGRGPLCRSGEKGCGEGRRLTGRWASNGPLRQAARAAGRRGGSFTATACFFRASPAAPNTPRRGFGGRFCTAIFGSCGSSKT